MTEGQPGREMYMLTSGELEVLEGVVEGERRGHDAAKRLGFLSDGAFCALPSAVMACPSTSATLPLDLPFALTAPWAVGFPGSTTSDVASGI